MQQWAGYKFVYNAECDTCGHEYEIRSRSIPVDPNGQSVQECFDRGCKGAIRTMRWRKATVELSTPKRI